MSLSPYITMDKITCRHDRSSLLLQLTPRTLKPQSSLTTLPLVFSNLKIVAQDLILTNLLGGSDQAMAGHPNTITHAQDLRNGISIIFSISYYSIVRCENTVPRPNSGEPTGVEGYVERRGNGQGVSIVHLSFHVDASVFPIRIGQELG